LALIQQNKCYFAPNHCSNVTFFQSEELHIVRPKATYHITRQASRNARASVRYPI